MLRWAAIASSRAMTRILVALSRLSIIHRPMAPAATGIRPLLLDSVAPHPSDFSRGYARGRSKAISTDEDEDEDDSEEISTEYDDEFGSGEDFDHEDFDDVMVDDDDDDDEEEEYRKRDRN